MNAFFYVNKNTLLPQAKLDIPLILIFYGNVTKTTQNLYISKTIWNPMSAIDKLTLFDINLAIYPIITQINYKFNVWQLDD